MGGLRLKGRKKTCAACGGSGPFGLDRSTSDGLRSYCKPCMSRRQKEYQKTHPKMLQKHARRYRKKHAAKLNDRAKEYQRRVRENQPETYLWRAAKRRAAERGLAFTIDLADVVIPAVCPLLGVPLRAGRGVVSARSPTLDRKDAALGYVKGNVWVISHRANTIKQDATVEELSLLARNLRNALAGKSP